MYWFSRSSAFAAGVLIFLGGGAVRGDVIASWDFNDSNLLVDQGVGNLTTTFLTSDVTYPTGTTKNARPGVAAGRALGLEDRVNNLFGRLDFTLTMSGYRGLVMSLASQRTSTGFSSNQIAYSPNGGATFTNLGSPLNPPTAFDTSTLDFSGIQSLNDNPNVMVRITFSGATSTTGNNRIDNVQFTAEAVSTPEPSSAVLAGVAVGLFGLQWWRRKVSGDRCQGQSVRSCG